eukprot:scaffold56676_cov20-Tisochrysis_lutea.AAC.1
MAWLERNDARADFVCDASACMKSSCSFSLQVSLPLPSCHLKVVAPSVLGLKAAYQGVPGAYSEVAAHKGCPGYGTLPCDQFEVAFQ